MSHEGFFVWQYPRDVDYVGFDHTLNLTNNYTYHAKRAVDLLKDRNETFSKVSILMLSKYDVDRYCPVGDFFSRRPMEPRSAAVKNRVVGTHCFRNLGPLGEHGVRKSRAKMEIMLKTRTWTIREDFDYILSDHVQKHGVATRPVYLTKLKGSHSNALLFKNLIDPDYAKWQRKVWME